MQGPLNRVAGAYFLVDTFHKSSKKGVYRLFACSDPPPPPTLKNALWPLLFRVRIKIPISQRDNLLRKIIYHTFILYKSYIIVFSFFNMFCFVVAPFVTFTFPNFSNFCWVILNKIDFWNTYKHMGHTLD